MKKRVLVLGAGFGGLELTTVLSETIGDKIDLVLIDRNPAFAFGFSKLDVLFGRKTRSDVEIAYRELVKRGVRFVQQTITAIDPVARRVTTNGGVFDADFVVVALGADYDFDATPGLTEWGNEFYTMAGAARAAEKLASFASGDAVVGICSAVYKCPPAPSETALLLHYYLVSGGHRDRCTITLVFPFGAPVPPSTETSDALLDAFAERQIRSVTNRRVSAVAGSRHAAILDDGTELPCDLFLGVPVHCVPKVLDASGLVEGGWIPVNRETMATRFAGVYAIGDAAHTGAPKAGVFAEGAARTAASALIAIVEGSGPVEIYAGSGSCYVEFGDGRIGRVDVDFFSGPAPTNRFQTPSAALVAEKAAFASTRRARWFGSEPVSARADADGSVRAPDARSTR
jgi:sulfide:quinone oxidoreductase